MLHLAYGSMRVAHWTKIEWWLMTIAEIISEIDAYLLRLCNARDLLLAPMREARRKGEPGRKWAVRASKTGKPLSSQPRLRGNESRFDRMIAQVTTPKPHLDSSSAASSIATWIPSTS